MPKNKGLGYFPMYDETRSVLTARKEAIDHDQPLLERLMDDGISVKESWELLQDIQSETIRYHAACDFLQEILGEGTIDTDFTGRFRFMQNGTLVLLPGPECRDRSIYVQIDNINEPLTQLVRPKPTPIDYQEQLASEYITLLETNAPLNARIMKRLGRKKLNFWNYIVYFVWVVPKDFLLCHRNCLYWRSVIERRESERKKKDEAAMVLWMKNKDAFRHFYFGMYRVLEQFGFPVYLGTPSNGVIVEQMFKALENQS